MGARPRLALILLVAALFAAAAVSVPGIHTRAVIERAAFTLAYAMPDGTLPGICPDGAGISEVPDGHHAKAAACLACVIMTAPGFAPMALAALARLEPPDRVRLAPVAVAAAGLAWNPAHARAPPSRTAA
jgi:hypothetical protein